MRTVKVLVADDEATVREFIRIVIGREQLPVSSLIEADNGIEAVRLARECTPDIVFLDIRMPGQDGLRAAETILSANPGTSVVIVSAYNEFEYVRTAFRSGVVDYLLKPIRPVDIAEVIWKVARQCEYSGDAVRAKTAKKPALVTAVENFVDRNLDKPIQLKDIAQAVFVSSYHLSRSFKSLTGQSIVNFIQEQRLAKAEELLALSELSIAEVAELVGFNDSAYFATCFKHKIGISPMQYRKMQDFKNKSQKNK